MVLVAHSLGGLVVKEVCTAPAPPSAQTKLRQIFDKALQIVYKQRSDYRAFLRSLAAVILLGTPHSTNQDDWKHFANVLHTGSGTQKKRAMTTDEMAALAETSTRFEQAGVSVPVFSICETQKTKVRKNMISTSKIMVSMLNQRIKTSNITDH